MSHIFSYSKELASHTQDPKERAAAIKSRRGGAEPFGLEWTTPRVRPFPIKNLNVTVPLSYLVVSRIKKFLKKN